MKNPLVTENDLNYEDLRKQLKYPNNPAYFRVNKFLEDKEAIIPFLQFCRDHEIPFNQADKIIYKIHESKENFRIFNEYIGMLFERGKDRENPEKERVLEFKQFL